MTKHKKVQNGIFWNILEYSGTLFLKESKNEQNVFFFNNVKIIKIVHQPYSFLYEQQQQQQ